MNDPDGDGPEGEDRADGARSWCELDDTLADGPAAASVPDAAKPWLAEQRFVHGLLRALHTADAAARESRVAAILERVRAEPARGRAPRARWLLVVAVAALLAVAGLWLALADRLPSAHAAVERAVAQLARDVDRRYRVEIVGAGTPASGMPASGAPAKAAARHEFALVTRPGNRFRLDGKIAFGGMQLGELRVGCDGTDLWLVSANGAFRRSVPLADRERLLGGFGDALDLGYLDVHDLVRRLPESFELHVVGREVGADGRPLLRIEAKHQSGRSDAQQGPARAQQGPARAQLDPARAQLGAAHVFVDEQTGMIVHIVAEVAGGRGGVRSLTFEYLGEEPAGLVDYRRPW